MYLSKYVKHKLSKNNKKFTGEIKEDINKRDIFAHKLDNSMKL